MRMLHTIPILSFLIAILSVAPAGAGEADEASLEILVITIQANKKALVAVNMELEDTEAKAFWPVYDRYQSELAVVRDRFVKLVGEYTTNFVTMNDDQARQIFEDYLAIERDRAEVRRKYLGPIAETLPGRKVARFYQIENKIDAVLRYQLAQDIPVIEQ